MGKITVKKIHEDLDYLFSKAKFDDCDDDDRLLEIVNSLHDDIALVSIGTPKTRRIALFSGMIKWLWIVAKHCEKTGQTVIDMKEIKRVVRPYDKNIESKYARFSDLVWLDLIGRQERIAGKQRGLYIIDYKKILSMFENDDVVISRLIKENKTNKIIEVLEMKKLSEVRGLDEFLDVAGQYIN